jgi:hypothetical protein
LFPQWRAAIKAEQIAATDFDALAATAKGEAEPPLTPDSFMKRQEAIEAAHALRPIRLTVCCSLTPPAAYGFVAAMFWVLRGFRRENDTASPKG